MEVQKRREGSLEKEGGLRKEVKGRSEGGSEKEKREKRGKKRGGSEKNRERIREGGNEFQRTSVVRREGGGEKGVQKHCQKETEQ